MSSPVVITRARSSYNPIINPQESLQIDNSISSIALESIQIGYTSLHRFEAHVRKRLI